MEHQEKKKKMKGFTLIEMIISMAILVIMSTALAGMFSSGFSSYGSSRELERNLETAQYALNTLEKLLRTSTVVLPSAVADTVTKSILFYDYSSKRCFKYTINTVSHKLEARWFQTNDPFGLSGGPVCDDVHAMGSSVSDLTNGYITGNFFVVRSVPTAGSKKMGRVTVNLSVKESATATLESHIQATASLRDYSYVGY